MAKVNLEEINENPSPEETNNPDRKINFKKKRTIDRLIEVFIGKDVGSIKDYILFDVLIPAIKSAIVDGVKMLLGVDGGYSSKRRGYDDDTPYSTYYKSNRRNDNRNDSSRRHIRNDYRDIVFASEDDARDAIGDLKTRAHKYNTASVADYKDILQITGAFTDNYWGWSREEIDDLAQKGPRKASGGWVIDLPEVHDVR